MLNRDWTKTSTFSLYMKTRPCGAVRPSSNDASPTRDGCKNRRRLTVLLALFSQRARHVEKGKLASVGVGFLRKLKTLGGNHQVRIDPSSLVIHRFPRLHISTPAAKTRRTLAGSGAGVNIECTVCGRSSALPRCRPGERAWYDACTCPARHFPTDSLLGLACRAEESFRSDTRRGGRRAGHDRTHP
jgi:hypothetical protein